MGTKKKNQVVRRWGLRLVELAMLAWWTEEDWAWWKVVVTVIGVRTRASAEVCGSRGKRISEGTLSDFWTYFNMRHKGEKSRDYLHFLHCYENFSMKNDCMFHIQAEVVPFKPAFIGCDM